MTTIAERAFAKVNLTLEVLGRRLDGYHELSSLVAFAADAFDTVTLVPDRALEVRVAGPMASAIDGENLISALVSRLLEHQPGLRVGSFLLEKRLPVAAGIGGGSADAAAAARAIARLNGIDDPAAAFGQVAAIVGADIPVCLGAGGAAAAVMTGIGETIWRPPVRILPPGGFPAVLVNPGVPVPTAAVFRALAAPPIETAPATCCPPSVFDIEAIVAGKNDLEAPAISIAPAIAETLDAISRQEGCLLARMSGSGATCFGIYAGMPEATRAARSIVEARPGWWVAATRLV